MNWVICGSWHNLDPDPDRDFIQGLNIQKTKKKYQSPSYLYKLTNLQFTFCRDYTPFISLIYNTNGGGEGDKVSVLETQCFFLAPAYFLHIVRLVVIVFLPNRLG